MNSGGGQIESHEPRSKEVVYEASINTHVKGVYGKITKT